jgi:group I intron endonuclease
MTQRPLSWNPSPRKIELFWGTINCSGPDECWLHKGKSDHPSSRILGWHTSSCRIAFVIDLISKGLPIPEDFDDFEVMHHCNATSCCNPNHLYLGRKKLMLRGSGGVYQIRNLVTGRIYIGSSTNVATRWYQHRRGMKDGVPPCRSMSDDLRRHGMESFVFEILEKCDRKVTRVCEQKWLNKYRPFDSTVIYNVCEDSTGPKGRKYPDSHKNAIRESLNGVSFTPERCAAISAARKASPKAKAAIEAHNADKRALSDDDVRRIRSLGKSGKQQWAIAEEFGVSRRVIRAILGGETYREVI